MEKEFSIYKAAAIDYGVDFKTQQQTLDSRGIGYARSREQLIEDIHRHGEDLVQAKWSYIVVEQVPEGIDRLPVEGTEEWFRYNNFSNKWEPTDKPFWAQGITFFTQ